MDVMHWKLLPVRKTAKWRPKAMPVPACFEVQEHANDGFFGE
jgi:hypothetical protein